MRRFEFVGGGSAKFWTCKVEGGVFTIVFGRLGSDGQRKEKEFDDEDDAQAEMAKKITEKLKEGYVEVAVDGAAAPAASEKSGKKGAEATSLKLVMPPRFDAVVDPDAALIKSATTALKALARATAGRSWRRAIAAKEARRALHRVRGVELSAHKDLAAAFDDVVDAVTSKPALPLSFVLALCDELPADAFARALARWKKPAGPSTKAITTLQEIRKTLDDDELALRASLAICDNHAADAAALARFAKVRSSVEAGASESGGLKKWLAAMDNGDVVVARRTALFAA